MYSYKCDRCKKEVGKEEFSDMVEVRITDFKTLGKPQSWSKAQKPKFQKAEAISISAIVPEVDPAEPVEASFKVNNICELCADCCDELLTWLNPKE